MKLVDVDVEELKNDEEKHDLKNRYIKPFLKRCQEIMTKREEILKSLREVVTQTKIEDYKVSLEETGDENGENFLLKMQKPEAKDEKFNFVIGVTLQDDNILTFQTAFFESEIGLQIVSETSLKSEFQELVEKTLRHFHSFQNLSNNEPSEHSHEIDCQKIISAHTEVKNMNDFTF